MRLVYRTNEFPLFWSIKNYRLKDIPEKMRSIFPILKIFNRKLNCVAANKSKINSRIVTYLRNGKKNSQKDCIWQFLSFRYTCSVHRYIHRLLHHSLNQTSKLIFFWVIFNCEYMKPVDDEQQETHTLNSPDMHQITSLSSMTGFRFRRPEGKNVICAPQFHIYFILRSRFRFGKVGKGTFTKIKILEKVGNNKALQSHYITCHEALRLINDKNKSTSYKCNKQFNIIIKK